jgi:hypothetical protein
MFPRERVDLAFIDTAPYRFCNSVSYTAARFAADRQRELGGLLRGVAHVSVVPALR